MDPSIFEKIEETVWRVDQHGEMRVPAIIYADEDLIREMDDMVLKQITNVAKLPGIVEAAYAMPDAHWGYGFPIGGVAAFDPDEGGIISVGGVGFDISCGVRTLRTGLRCDQIAAVQRELADALFEQIPAGIGSTGSITLSDPQMEAMLAGGAKWAIAQGWGEDRDLERTEENGCMAGAQPAEVSAKARKRQRREMGTLGSGNHYLEVQRVAELFDEGLARAFGLVVDDVVVAIHCGSRGLGHQIGTEYLQRMAQAPTAAGFEVPDRELACAPISSDAGRSYIGAMRAGINCALANRQILTHLTREVFAEVLPEASLELLYDVSHNTCKEEEHVVAGKPRQLFVHRKGATRAFGPGHPSLPEALKEAGQPVFIGGSMGTESFILAGVGAPSEHGFSSACHGAGRRMSRRQAKKTWSGRQIVDDLGARGITIRSVTSRGVAEEAPGAYKDVAKVVEVAETAGLAKRVARVEPMVCIKG